MNKVSIIIPVYNSEKYLKKCVDSILNQIYKNIEIIIIDDGSKDNSYEVIKELEKENPTIIKGFTQENQGVANTRNNGVQYASGDFIMFSDNDDYLDKDCVEVFVNAIVKEEADIVVGGYRRVSTDGKVLMERKLSEDSSWSKYVQICPWAKIYKRDFLIKNNLKFLSYPIGEDMYMNLIAYYKSSKVVSIEYVGYNWLYNVESISSTIHKRIGKESDPVPMLEAIVKEIGNDEKFDDGLYEFAYVKFIVWYLLYSCKGADKNEIIEEYDKLFKWLNSNFPNYKKNKNIGIFKPKGETLPIRLSVVIFIILHKIGLGKKFLTLYSKI